MTNQPTSDDAYLRPPATVLGKKLRPLTAGSYRQFEKCCQMLRDRLDGLYTRTPSHDAECDTAKGACHLQCRVYRRAIAASEWLTLVFVFIHSAPQTEVSVACWDAGKLFAAVDATGDGFTTKQIDDAGDAVTEILKQRKEQFSVATEGTSDPNS